mmetsp:Transcript_6715/g.23443  ORF Transcript_6715/g.23443 Transcript_6715/m.23443 type:complete len:235 (+) Transcript_6715:37-741(+)
MRGRLPSVGSGGSRVRIPGQYWTAPQAQAPHPRAVTRTKCSIMGERGALQASTRDTLAAPSIRLGAVVSKGLSSAAPTQHATRAAPCRAGAMVSTSSRSTRTTDSLPASSPSRPHEEQMPSILEGSRAPATTGKPARRSSRTVRCPRRPVAPATNTVGLPAAASPAVAASLVGWAAERPLAPLVGCGSDVRAGVDTTTRLQRCACGMKARVACLEGLPRPKAGLACRWVDLAPP